MDVRSCVLFLLLLQACTPPMVYFPDQDLYIHAELARTRDERSQGLSGRESLEGGMLFIFEDEAIRTFWMKDMKFPLDILFLDGDKTVVHLIEDAQPCATTCPLLPSRSPAQYVLEVPAGFIQQHTISIGQQLQLPS